ncbi:MAG: dihydropteroate synthase [Candidatus Methylomirabilia bacterium]
MPNRALLGGLSVGAGLPVVVLGVLNVGPESFYRGSVASDPDQLLRMAEKMVEAGAAVLDVGAMSTAPYLPGRIAEGEETDRLSRAVRLLVEKLGVPISADTTRAAPARAALDAGATIINDVSGVSADSEMAELVARRGAALILTASPGVGASRVQSVPPARPSSAPSVAVRERPEQVVFARLGQSLALARRAGIAREGIVVDPGIGFFRDSGWPWQEWDCRVLARLGELHRLEQPICVGVSRKSFIGAILGEEDPGRRLVGSLAATAVAVANGADLIRTHDVGETIGAVRIAEAIRAAGFSGTA